jgi:DNA-binding XRE family transcriptional regulator
LGKPYRPDGVLLKFHVHLVVCIAVVIASANNARSKVVWLWVVLNAEQLIVIRKSLTLSQEHMARLLGVSFASVNRWEGGHSSPTGPSLDLYSALSAAIKAGNTPQAIHRAANNDRGTFLYTLFRMAYSRPARRS